MTVFKSTFALAISLLLLLPLIANAQTATERPTYSLTVSADPPECAKTEGAGKYASGTEAKTRYYNLADNCQWIGYDVSHIADSFGPGCDMNGSGDCYFTINSDIDVTYVFEISTPTPVPIPIPVPTPLSYYNLNALGDPSSCATIEGGGKYLAGSKVETRYTSLADNCRWIGWDVIYFTGTQEPGCTKGNNECYFTMDTDIEVTYEFEVAKPTPTKIIIPTATPRPTLTPTPRPLPTSTPRPLVKPTLTPTPRLRPIATPRPLVKPTPTPTPRLRPTATPRPLVKPTLTPTPRLRPTATPRPLVKPTLTPTPRLRPIATPRPPVKPTPTPTSRPISVPSSIDLSARIDTGIEGEIIKLVCGGISEASSLDSILCQVSNTQDKGGDSTTLSPNQWPIIVENKGTKTVTGYIVDIVLSSDLKAPVKYAPPLGPNIAEDVLIEPGRLDDGPPLGANSSAIIRVGIGPLPHGIKSGEYGLCTVVDPGKLIEESNEKNNVFCVPTEISEFSKDESGFSGTVYVDNITMANNAILSGYIAGEKVGDANVSDGSYSLQISQPLGQNFAGLPIEFRLFVDGKLGDGVLLEQTAYWEAGNISEIDFRLSKTRGFLVNPPLGEFGEKLSWNNIDANLLSIVGILLTLVTAGISLFKSD